MYSSDEWTLEHMCCVYLIVYVLIIGLHVVLGPADPLTV